VDLLEFQGKQFFASFGIPVSPGHAVDSVRAAANAAADLGYPVVVKAQVHVGGRGKAGGVKLASDATELRGHAENIIGMDIKGHRVHIVWIERASDIAEEYYASFTLDRARKQHLGMLSARGGVDIEGVAAEDPDDIPEAATDDEVPVGREAEAVWKAWTNAHADDSPLLAAVRRAFDRYDGDISKAAQALGLSRSALYRRLEKYQIE